MSQAASMRICEDPRPRSEVTRRLTAYSVWEKPPGNTRALEKGTIVWLDPDFESDNATVNGLIVRFLYGDVWFYTDRETFERSTRVR